MRRCHDPPLTCAGLPCAQARLAPAPACAAGALASTAAAFAFGGADTARLVLRNGTLAPELCHVGTLPPGVFFGPLSAAPPAAAAALALHLAAAAAAVAATAGDAAGVLPALNAACAGELFVFFVPAGVAVPAPVHLLHLAGGSAGAPPAGGAACAAWPRLLVALEAGASASLVTEYDDCASDGGPDGHNSVVPIVLAAADVALAERARLTHAHLTRGAISGAVLAATTSVTQAAHSAYELTHVSLTARGLSRHDVRIAQLGVATATTQRAFLLVGTNATGDLHTALELSHPDGKAEQLHKCIVASATGRGVFDGGVRVGRAAQRTDAAQLSRNLLLVPKAAVNVKPNLQIVADDVKCTHGCTVSDLDEEELFYFRARGIDAAAARDALVYSFGAEVVGALGCGEQLAARLRAEVQRALVAAQEAK